jgi:hypothetical protein
MSTLKINRQTIGKDVIAGLTAAIAGIPDGMASATLAGVNPVYGLYNMMVGTPIAAIFTSSVYMAVINASAMALVAYDALAIYHESEHKSASVESAVSNEEGLAIYLESEWADYQRARSSSNKEGLAIYHESEHKSASVELAVSNEEGLAIYLESERYGAEALPVRLFNGKPFNAYQRSEWLGAER